MPFAILYVCTGNICRSPFAERLTRARFDALPVEDARSVTVASAGIRGMTGHSMDAAAAAELVRFGGTPDGFVARELAPPDVAHADLVLTATKRHRQLVLEMDPRALRRCFTIRELAELVGQTGPVTSPHELIARAAARRGSATLDDYDVPDPIGASAQVHAEVADTIVAAVGPIIDALAGSIRSGR